MGGIFSTKEAYLCIGMYKNSFEFLSNYFSNLSFFNNQSLHFHIPESSI